MIDFANRSYKKELLDGADLPFEDIRQNMRELNFINTYLGGHSITLKGYKTLANGRRKVSVCEIGCGGGDNLIAIKKWCEKHQVEISLTGIDINAGCINYAKENQLLNDADFIASDYKLITFQEKPDIIFSSLFCHHFTDDQLLQMLVWMKNNSRLGFFINDLHRHPVAYYFIKMTTGIFSSSYLVKNDAPLSVLRGFKKSEWIQLLDKAGIKKFKVRWKWAFRYLITAS